MTDIEIITWLDSLAAAYDLRREVHVRNDATFLAAIAQVQAKTIADTVKELREKMPKGENILVMKGGA